MRNVSFQLKRSKVMATGCQRPPQQCGIRRIFDVHVNLLTADQAPPAQAPTAN